jgi:hypothetical protein
VHHGFLFYDHGGAGCGVIEKDFRHPFWQADATVRRRVRRHVALVHRVAAPEKHRERHPGPIVMRPRRFGILAHVDIRFRDVTGIVHIIAEDARDVLRILPENRVITGRRPKARLAGGDRGFADQVLALVEISALLGNADDNFRGAGNPVAVPVAWRRRRRGGCGRGGGDFGAAGDQDERAKGEGEAKEGGAAHLDAQVNVFGFVFNLKDLKVATGFPERARQE